MPGGINPALVLCAISIKDNMSFVLNTIQSLLFILIGVLFALDALEIPITIEHVSRGMTIILCLANGIYLMFKK